MGQNVNSSAATAPDERRCGQRQVTLMRVGLIHAGHGKDFCLVRNLSIGGLMARVYRRLQPGENVQVELKSGNLLVGKVVWAREDLIGVQFRSVVDVADVLDIHWDGKSDRRPRLPRLDLNCPAMVRQGAGPLGVLVRDISHRGAKISSHNRVVRPGTVVLTLPRLPAIHGVVRWIREDEAGLAFNECLPFDVLARCIAERRGPETDVTNAAPDVRADDRMPTPLKRLA